LLSASEDIGRKGEEVTGGWWNLDNEAFYDFYFSPNIIRVMKLINLINVMNKSGPFVWCCCHHVIVAVNVMK
jgi:hypothetical protein